MNEINSFTFYRDYYCLIDTLPIKDKKELAVAILDFVFKDELPNLTGHNAAIFNTLSHQLGVSKNKSKSAKKENQMEIKSKSNQNQMEIKKGNKTSISTFIFYISNFKFLKDRGLLRGKIEEWLKYKWERKEYYTEISFQTLLKKIEEETMKYGEKSMIDLIDDSISKNYKSIVFEKLEKQKTKPQWFDKTFEKEIPNEKEKKEMENLLKDFQ